VKDLLATPLNFGVRRSSLRGHFINRKIIIIIIIKTRTASRQAEALSAESRDVNKSRPRAAVNNHN
jgi:hypothetical protein